MRIFSCQSTLWSWCICHLVINDCLCRGEHEIWAHSPLYRCDYRRRAKMLQEHYSLTVSTSVKSMTTKERHFWLVGDRLIHLTFLLLITRQTWRCNLLVHALGVFWTAIRILTLILMKLVGEINIYFSWRNIIWDGVDIANYVNVIWDGIDNSNYVNVAWGGIDYINFFTAARWPSLPSTMEHFTAVFGHWSL